jgi:hypothetical protein
MPYIALIRDDIPEGTLQVLDLVPNTSLRNSIYDPQGQTKYIRRLQNDTVVASTVTAAEYKGLAAYIIDSVADGGTGNALTATQANDMADAIIAVLDAGTAMTLANVNTALQGVTALTELDANGSVGSLTELLQILAGGEYVVPAGTAADSTGAFKAAQAGAFTTGTYRSTYDSFALNISLAEGHLAGFMSADFEYGGTTGAALAVYDDTGALM